MWPEVQFQDSHRLLSSSELSSHLGYPSHTDVFLMHCNSFLHFHIPTEQLYCSQFSSSELSTQSGWVSHTSLSVIIITPSAHVQKPGRTKLLVCTHRTQCKVYISCALHRATHAHRQCEHQHTTLAVLNVYSKCKVPQMAPKQCLYLQADALTMVCIHFQTHQNHLSGNVSSHHMNLLGQYTHQLDGNTGIYLVGMYICLKKPLKDK